MKKQYTIEDVERVQEGVKKNEERLQKKKYRHDIFEMLPMSKRGSIRFSKPKPKGYEKYPDMADNDVSKFEMVYNGSQELILTAFCINFQAGSICDGFRAD